MAFQVVGALLADKGAPLLDEGDVKHFIERYLREKLATSDLYCREVRSKKVWVRTKSPTLQQEVYLLENDIKQQLAQEVDYDLKEVKVTQW